MVRNCQIFCRIARFPHFFASTARTESVWCHRSVRAKVMFLCRIVSPATCYKYTGDRILKIYPVFSFENLKNCAKAGALKITCLTANKSRKSNQQIWQVKPTNLASQTNKSPMSNQLPISAWGQGRFKRSKLKVQNISVREILKEEKIKVDMSMVSSSLEVASFVKTKYLSPIVASRF